MVLGLYKIRRLRYNHWTYVNLPTCITLAVNKGRGCNMREGVYSGCLE